MDKWDRYRGYKPKSELNRKLIDAHARLLLSVLLAIKLTLPCYMCDLYSKFEEDRTKIAFAIVDYRCFGQTDRQTDKHTSDFISVHCHALHWTDNE